MTIDTPESIKIRMLWDAGYDPTELQMKYLLLVDFANKIRKISCVLDDNCLACNALKLLRKIKEIE